MTLYEVLKNKMLEEVNDFQDSYKGPLPSLWENTLDKIKKTIMEDLPPSKLKQRVFKLIKETQWSFLRHEFGGLSVLRGKFTELYKLYSDTALADDYYEYFKGFEKKIEDISTKVSSLQQQVGNKNILEKTETKTVQNENTKKEVETNQTSLFGGVMKTFFKTNTNIMSLKDNEKNEEEDEYHSDTELEKTSFEN